MRHIIWGVVIIAIGLFGGHSVFTGHPGLADYAFDGLAVCFIGYGIYSMVTGSKKDKQIPPP